MGIDAEMFVKLQGRQVTDDEILAVSRALTECLGFDRFWCFGATDHAMHRVDKIDQDGPTIKPKPGETFARIRPATRYYGEGYERGDFALIATIREIVLVHWPDAEVWYGGDSSGVLHEHMTDDFTSSLFAHFAKKGHRRYGSYFDRQPLAGKANPCCERCKTETIRNGWGGVPPNEYACWYCPSCNFSIETRDSGKTIQNRTEMRRQAEREKWDVLRAVANGNPVEPEIAERVLRGLQS